MSVRKRLEKKECDIALRSSESDVGKKKEWICELHKRRALPNVKQKRRFLEEWEAHNLICTVEPSPLSNMLCMQSLIVKPRSAIYTTPVTRRY